MNVPFFKAIKMGKTVVDALRAGRGLVGIMSLVGAFICSEIWDAYWSWRECKRAAEGDGTAALTQEDWDALADDLEREFSERGMGWT